jgi:hypothetical protein
VQEGALELPELVSPVLEVAQTQSESQPDLTQYLPELPSFELHRSEEVATATASDSPHESEKPAQSDTEAAPELKDFSWAAPVQPAEIAIDRAAEAHAPDLTSAEMNSEPAERSAPGLATLAPFLASLTSAASLRSAGIEKPFDFDALTALSGEDSPGSSDVAIAEPLHLPGAPPMDPALIEAIAQRVIERMQPQIIDLVTRELLRPAVEALVQRELEKK